MKSNSFDVEVSSLHILDCPLPDLFTGRTGPPQKQSSSWGHISGIGLQMHVGF